MMLREWTLASRPMQVIRIVRCLGWAVVMFGMGPAEFRRPGWVSLSARQEGLRRPSPGPQRIDP
ncbi:hypothetical protein BKG68_23375 [Mycobacteroides saopaulense]|uniref:Uncharacterized protein n=1 Tax=Mycobacteroides saopaulense TaxID=1578165 RepID=A0ABX3BWK0_9MYCO|nr:hypothetical protein BKG68_23375 [Mycobacteroides saopaulense]OHU07335.1 hypothetical protein BKG73_18980 [Mycobacteroides saopaulense]